MARCENDVRVRVCVAHFSALTGETRLKLHDILIVWIIHHCLVKNRVDNDMAAFCTRCGTRAIDEQSVYCTRCGTKLIRSPEKKDSVCPGCGNKILNKQSVFCDRCGSQLSAISPVRVQQTGERPLVTRLVIKKKSCPNCGAPLPDEYRYYCNSCGAYLQAH